MLSIRFDSNESTRIVSPVVDSLYRGKSIWEILRKYSVPGLYNTFRKYIYIFMFIIIVVIIQILHLFWM